MTARPLAAFSLIALTACGVADDRADDSAAASSPSATARTVDHTTVDHTDAFRDPDVPDLPFDDNPDPDQCGIPVRWGTDEPAWLTGIWDGELIEPDVLLYDSHGRLSISGRAPHGSEVRIELYQRNPVLDYYLVRTVDGLAEGWVPEPFLSFEPIAP